MMTLSDDKIKEILLIGCRLEAGAIEDKEAIHQVRDILKKMKESTWISVEEGLPLEINKEGKRLSKRSLVFNGKSIEKAIYYPQKFALCQWEDLDEDELHYDVEAIDQDYWLKEGWWTEYENNTGELMQARLAGVTHWMPLPQPPYKN